MPLILLLLAALGGAAEVVNANVASAEMAPVFRESVPFAAVIQVRNPHQRAVRVSKIDTTCSCSKLELASYFLIPGETTTLTVEAANKQRSGPQQIRVSLFVSDPDLEPIEIMCWWQTRPAVAVDAIAPGQPTLERPDDNAWRDIYRYVAHERPDEPQRLRKRILFSCPPEETPPGGLRIEGVDYPGTLWAFAIHPQENGTVLVVATARDQQGPLPTGTFAEKAVVRTNHPDKANITLNFDVLIGNDAGRISKDFQGGMAPPMMPPPGP